ncbi:MAG: ATPase [Desulfovibrio sp.]|jgi:trk system potassium uptake protein TrkH|nr:ATPase [Desulfovibrio sp.]
MQSNKVFSPLTWPVISFFAAIFLGTLLLCLPKCAPPSTEISLIDACFLSASAVCVTGLTPLNISAALTPFGQGVLLFLIQLGGLGVMTYTCLVFLLWSRHVPFTSREAVGQMLLGSEFNLKTFLRQIVGLVFGIEAVAAILLHLHDPVAFHPFSAVFHAVSAFCNAGFSLNADSLMGFRDDVVVNSIITASVFLGGIGFAVLRETLGLLSCGRMGAPVTCFSRFSRLVVKTSIFLILTGSSLVFCMEFLRSGNEHTLGQGFDLAITAFFQSVVARTAGFNTVNVAALSEATLLVYMALMFIGGAPGSCAGGIKVVTFRVLAGYIAAQFRGDREIVLEERSVPRSNVTRALTLFFLYTTLISLSVFLLSITENGILRGAERDRVSLMSILFEEISALGTVGLSVGLTPLLSSEGKAVIILNMFAGRVGLISLLMAVQSLRPKKFYTHAEAQLPIG